MFPALMLALLAGLPNPLAGFHGPRGGDIQRSSQDVAGWRLEAKRDAFAGRTACRLQRDGATYERGVITFRFAPNVNTAQAEFRVDAGTVQSAGAVAVEAAGLGARLHPDRASNDSGGLVAIPARLLLGAKSVLVRPNAKLAHREFNLRGLPTALDAARKGGCDLGPQTSQVS
jgi:hypothetical protein